MNYLINLVQNKKYDVLVVVLLLLISVVMSVRHDISPPVPDGYAKYGYSLSEFGVYAVPNNSLEKPEPGQGRAPLFPLVTSLLMDISPDYKAYVACHIDQKDTCVLSYGIVQIFYFVIFITSFYLAYLIALRLGANPLIASFTIALSSIGPMKWAAAYRMSEHVALPLFAIACYLLLLWFKPAKVDNKYLIVAFAIGIMLGLLSLTRVIYTYFVPLLMLVIIIIPPYFHEIRLKKRIAAASLLLLGFFICISPWSIRNYIHFGTAQIVAGQSGVSGVLEVRHEYNKMTLTEGAAAMIYWIPVFGDTLAMSLFPEKITNRFFLDHPESYRKIALLRGENTLQDKAKGKNIKKVFLQEILKDPLPHILVSIPITVRGLKFSLLLAPFALIALICLLRRKYYWIIGVISLTLINLLIHAGLTHFRGRYGAPMLYSFGPMAALGLTFIWQYIQSRTSPATTNMIEKK